MWGIMCMVWRSSRHVGDGKSDISEAMISEWLSTFVVYRISSSFSYI